MKIKMNQYSKTQILWVIALLNPDKVEIKYKDQHAKFLFDNAGTFTCNCLASLNSKDGEIIAKTDPFYLNLPDGYSYKNGSIIGISYHGGERQEHKIPVYNEKGERWTT